MFTTILLVLIVVLLIVVCIALNVINDNLIAFKRSSEREASSNVLLLRGVQARQDEQTELQKKGFVIKPDYNKLSGARQV